MDASQIRGAALVWDLQSGAAPRRFRFIGEVVPQVALDERGEVLFTSQPLTRRSVATGASRVLVPHDWFWSLAVLPDGDVLGIDGNTPTRVDGSSGEVLARYPSDGSFLMSLRVRPDGRRFIVISSDEREVREWNVVDAEEPRGTFSLDRGNANAVDYSADGTFVYASGRGGTALRRWDLTGERGYVSTVPTSSRWGGQFGVVAADGQRSVVLADGGWVLSDYRTGKVGVIPGPGGFRHTYGAFHPDGQHFATAAGTRVEVWDGAGKPTGRQTVFPSGKLTELDYTPDGSRLAVAELDGTITLLDGDSLERVGTPVAMEQPVSWVVARPDGRTAVVLLGGVFGLRQLRVPEPRLRPWLDLVDGVVVRRGTLEMRYGHWLDVSPTARAPCVGGGGSTGTAPTAGDRANVEVIDLSTGRLVAPAREWGGNPRSQVIFSPDGTRLLSSSPNGLVAVWDAGTVTPTSTIALPLAVAASGAFLPDGRTARFLDWFTGMAYDWDLSTDSAVEFSLPRGRSRPHAGGVGRELRRPALPRDLPPVGLESRRSGWSPTSCGGGADAHLAPGRQDREDDQAAGSDVPHGRADVHASTLRRPGIAAVPAPPLPS